MEANSASRWVGRYDGSRDIAKKRKRTNLTSPSHQKLNGKSKKKLNRRCLRENRQESFLHIDRLLDHDDIEEKKLKGKLQMWFLYCTRLNIKQLKGFFGILNISCETDLEFKGTKSWKAQSNKTRKFFGMSKNADSTNSSRTTALFSPWSFNSRIHQVSCPSRPQSIRFYKVVKLVYFNYLIVILTFNNLNVDLVVMNLKSNHQHLNGLQWCLYDSKLLQMRWCFDLRWRRVRQILQGTCIWLCELPNLVYLVTIQKVVCRHPNSFQWCLQGWKHRPMRCICDHRWRQNIELLQYHLD